MCIAHQIMQITMSQNDKADSVLVSYIISYKATFMYFLFLTDKEIVSYDNEEQENIPLAKMLSVQKLIDCSS